MLAFFGALTRLDVLGLVEAAFLAHGLVMAVDLAALARPVDLAALVALVVFLEVAALVIFLGEAADCFERVERAVPDWVERVEAGMVMLVCWRACG